MQQERTRSTRRILGVVAVAALLVVAGCAGGASGGGGAPTDGSGGGSGEGDSSGGGSGGDAPEFGSYYDEDGDRVVVRSAEMRLRVDDFGAAFRKARTVVRESGGYVGDRAQTGRGEYDRGYFVAKVPAGEFSRVRDAIADLGRIRNETVTIEDFTRTYRNRTDRLAELRADERRLERALANASGDAATVRAELQSVRSTIADLEASTERLRRRSAMSTIRVELVEPERKKPSTNAVEAAGIADSFVEAFYGGMAVVRVLVAVVGWTIPVGAAVLVLTAAGAGTVPVLRRGWRSLRRLVRAGDPPAGNARHDDGPSGEGGERRREDER